MTMPVLVPRPRLVDFGPGRNRTAGRGIADRRPDEPPHREFDLDQRTASTKRLQRDLAPLDDRAIDGIGHQSETQFVPEAIDAAQLAIGG
jgi:hypothetical protein